MSRRNRRPLTPSRPIRRARLWLETLEDRAAPAAGPMVTAVNWTPTSKPLAPLTSLRVTFDQVMDTTTFTPADFVSFTGPGGPVTVTGVSPAVGFGNRVFDVSFNATAIGTYIYSFGPDIRDTTGRPMD